MRNLDKSILNQNNLDESFSSFTSEDVLKLRFQIGRVEEEISYLKRIMTPDYDVRFLQLRDELNGYKSQLASIPKSVIDAVDRNIKLQADLVKAEAEKNQAAQLLATQKEGDAIKSAIDKTKGVTSILDNKINDIGKLPTESNQNVKEESNQAQQVYEKKGNELFSLKNIIITVASISVLIGGFILIKHYKK
jgi:hypothetical protein